MLVLLEAFAFLTSLVVDQDDFFDHRAGVLARLNAPDLAAFIEKGGDPVLGWDSRGPAVRTEENCQGSARTYTYNEAGARIYTAFDAQKAEIVIVGDSYTNGDEVDDDETYPAQLASILNVPVANQGVGGYGPTQAFLNLKKKIGLYPRARVAVLAVMYENLHRMVNAYRPVLYSTSSDYTLKPFMAGGQIRPHPGEQAFAGIVDFKRYANSAFDTDFWSKPENGFPYTVSLIKALGSNYFYFRKLQKAFRKLGVPEYFLTFRSREIRDNLVSLLNSYAEFATQRGVKPVVIFIPRNRYDTQSAGRFIEANSRSLDDRLLVGDVAGFAGIDWNRFNLRETEGDNICHPSPYGYRMIAEYIAGFLKDNGAW